MKLPCTYLPGVNPVSNVFETILNIILYNHVNKITLYITVSHFVHSYKSIRYVRAMAFIVIVLTLYCV